MADFRRETYLQVPAIVPGNKRSQLHFFLLPHLSIPAYLQTVTSGQKVYLFSACIAVSMWDRFLYNDTIISTANISVLSQLHRWKSGADSNLWKLTSEAEAHSKTQKSFTNAMLFGNCDVFWSSAFMILPSFCNEHKGPHGQRGLCQQTPWPAQSFLWDQRHSNENNNVVTNCEPKIWKAYPSL